MATLQYGAAGTDLLMAGPAIAPRAVAGMFRCRPTQPTLNLIRKELSGGGRRSVHIPKQSNLKTRIIRRAQP